MSEPAQNRLKLDRFTHHSDTHHSDKNMLGKFHHGAPPLRCAERRAAQVRNAVTRILALTRPLADAASAAAMRSVAVEYWE